MQKLLSAGSGGEGGSALLCLLACCGSAGCESMCHPLPSLFACERGLGKRRKGNECLYSANYYRFSPV